MTLAEYITDNNLSRSHVALRVGVKVSTITSAMLSNKTRSVSLLRWARENNIDLTGSHIVERKSTKPARVVKVEGNGYLSMIIKCMQKGVKEIRVFNDDNLKIIVEYLSRQGIKYEIVAFNYECVHVRIMRGVHR